LIVAAVFPGAMMVAEPLAGEHWLRLDLGVLRL